MTTHRLREQPERLPRPHPPRAARPLLRARLGRGRHAESLQAQQRVVRALLHEAAVHHVPVQQ